MEALNLIAVDDEKDVQVLFQHFFSKEISDDKIHLYFENSGKRCLELLKSIRGDTVVLTDINMPGMTGIELLEKINKDYPQVKVILVSAYDKSRYEDQLNQYGAVDYISKPVDFLKLKSLVSKNFL